MHGRRGKKVRGRRETSDQGEVGKRVRKGNRGPDNVSSSHREASKNGAAN